MTTNALTACTQKSVFLMNGNKRLHGLLGTAREWNFGLGTKGIGGKTGKPATIGQFVGQVDCQKLDRYEVTI